MTTHTSVAQLNPIWHTVDASGQRLGRMASWIAMVLMGKNKPNYSRHLLTGDYVIVINAAQVEVTGKPSALKTYFRHTGYIGHLRATPMSDMLAEHPDRVIERAVKGMLPRNRLGRRMLKRLKIYAGNTHPHEAQVNASISKPRQEQKRTKASVSKIEEANAVTEVAAAVAEAPVNIEEALSQSRSGTKKANPASSTKKLVKKSAGQTGDKTIKGTQKAAKPRGVTPQRARKQESQ